jgi:hypothetical protein
MYVFWFEFFAIQKSSLHKILDRHHQNFFLFEFVINIHCFGLKY